MTKKLWVVEMSTEVVVLADTREAAIEEAEGLRYSDMNDPDYSAREMTYLPNGWDGTCIPFGQEGDDTIDQLVESGAAETYRTMRARVRAAMPDTSTTERVRLSALRTIARYAEEHGEAGEARDT